jgi:hypothetical protein
MEWVQNNDPTNVGAPPAAGNPDTRVARWLVSDDSKLLFSTAESPGAGITYEASQYEFSFLPSSPL